jgi:hypothetical protein
MGKPNMSMTMRSTNQSMMQRANSQKQPKVGEVRKLRGLKRATSVAQVLVNMKVTTM